MKYEVRARQTGKTTELIKMSAEKQMPILTMNEHVCKDIKWKALQLNLEIPEPISAYSVKNGIDRGIGGKKVLVDDVMYYHHLRLNMRWLMILTMIMRKEQEI